MIAKFTNLIDAQDYADQVHSYLSDNPKYVAERWADVTEIDSAFYVPILNGCLPLSDCTIVPEMPLLEQTNQEISQD